MRKKALLSIGRMWADTVERPFMDSLVQMLLYSQHTLCDPNEYIHYLWAAVSDHALGRNYLATEFLGDSILMLDCDHVFSPDLLQRLLFLKKKYSCRVLSGLYCYKFQPHNPVANRWLPDGNIEPLLDWDPKDEVIEIGPTGGGCWLIDRSVFNQIHNQLGQRPFDIIPGLSEDYSFASRCRTLGITTHLAVNVESHHLSPRMAIKVKDFQRTRKEYLAATAPPTTLVP